MSFLFKEIIVRSLLILFFAYGFLCDKKCVFAQIINILSSQFDYHIDQLEDALFHAFFICSYCVEKKTKMRETLICNERQSVMLLDRRRRDNIKNARERETEKEHQPRNDVRFFLLCLPLALSLSLSSTFTPFLS